MPQGGTKAQSRRKNKRKKVQGDSSSEMSQNESSASVPTGNVILPTAYMSSPPPNTGQVYHIMTNANGQNFATSTPVSGQYITSHNNGQNNNTILEEILKRLESVDQKLSKLDMIEHKVMAIEQKLVTVDSVMTDLTNKVKQVEHFTEFMSQQFDSTADKQKQLEKNQVEMNKIMQANDQMKADILDLKSRSMRDNL